MDATQIMMMPAAAGSAQASGLPVATANEVLAGLFGKMLGQNILGLEGLIGSGLNTDQPQPEVVLASPKDSIAALIHEVTEQDMPSTEPEPSIVNQLAAYAQLAVLQINNPPIVQQQVATVGAESADGMSVAAAAPTFAEQEAFLNVADVPSEFAGIQKEGQQLPSEIISRPEPAVAAKLTVPVQAGSGDKLKSVIPDVATKPVLQLDAGLSTGVESQVQKIQAPAQQITEQTETQPVTQEVAGAIKNTVAVVPQPVKFAQHIDVVAVTSGAEGQKNFSSEQQHQGSQLMAKSPEELVMQGEQLKPELLENTGTTSFRLPEQHAVPLHLGQPVIMATEGTVAENSKSLPQELIGRQVTDRLASHEIKQGNDQISLKLSPENLGNLQLNMRMDDNRLKLEIVAENRGVRDALLQQADELKETLARQNIKVDSFNVTTGNGNQSQQQSADWRQMAQEQRQYQPHYASLRTKGSAVVEGETSMKYFVPQYQSTIDVRF